MQKGNLVNIAYLGSRAFEEIKGEIVQTTSFVQREAFIEDYIATYCKLVEPTSQQEKEKLLLSGENRYYLKQKDFKFIPESPMSYWLGEKMLNHYIKGRNCLGMSLQYVQV